MQRYDRGILISLFIIFSLYWGCSSGEKEKSWPANEVQSLSIDTLHTFISFETHNIAQPIAVRILNNGHIAVADYNQQNISLLDKEGSLINSFGRRGRGPAEFLNIRDIFEIGNRIIVYDSHQNSLSTFNYKGELIEKESLSSSSMSKETTLINDSLYVIGTQGLNDSLFQILSIRSDSVFNFGKPKVEREERLDMKKNYNQLIAGQVPDLFKNSVTLRSDGTHIYAFFEALSKLHKYDLSGNLIWQKQITIPHNEQILKETVETAQNHSDAHSMPVLNYLADFLVIDDSIFILTSSPSDQPQKLFKLNAQGRIVAIFTLPETAEYVYNFDMSQDHNVAYFTSWHSGRVYKSIIPH